jgi:hypothetical protein
LFELNLPAQEYRFLSDALVKCETRAYGFSLLILLIHDCVKGGLHVAACSELRKQSLGTAARFMEYSIEPTEKKRDGEKPSLKADLGVKQRFRAPGEALYKK